MKYQILITEIKNYFDACYYDGEKPQDIDILGILAKHEDRAFKAKDKAVEPKDQAGLVEELREWADKTVHMNDGGANDVGYARAQADVRESFSRHQSAKPEAPANLISELENWKDKEPVVVACEPDIDKINEWEKEFYKILSRFTTRREVVLAEGKISWTKNGANQDCLSIGGQFITNLFLNFTDNANKYKVIIVEDKEA